MKSLLLSASLAVIFAGCSSTANIPMAQTSTGDALALIGPHGSQVTVVIMENKDYNLVVGSPNAPYLNKTLEGQGALLRNMHAIGHPSEPNYLGLFSGSTQGIHGDPCPIYFKVENSASELIAAGKTFAGYSESMPRNGYKGCYQGLYDRNHNPWVEFRNVPDSDNLVYHGFPSSPQSLVWIVPNLCHDTHDCAVKTGDKWLSQNLPPIIAWDEKHDGLLVLTWDEADPDNSGKNHVATVLVGPMVRAGAKSDEHVDHYSTLHTIDDILGIACIDKDCKAPVITGIWK